MNFKINDNCKYIDDNKLIDCKIIQIIQEYGPSILNYKLMSMDYTINTYYIIKLVDGRIFKVSENFLKQ